MLRIMILFMLYASLAGAESLPVASSQKQLPETAHKTSNKVFSEIQEDEEINQLQKKEQTQIERAYCNSAEKSQKVGVGTCIQAKVDGHDEAEPFTPQAKNNDDKVGPP